MTNSYQVQQKLKLYRLGDDYIASIDYKPNGKRKTNRKIETVVILDRSSSMDESFRTIVKQILPLCFKKLDFNLDEKIHLITFDTFVNYYHMSINEISQQKNFYSQGSTFLSVAVRKFHEIFITLQEQNVEFLNFNNFRWRSC